jgi:hypothetical protein
VRPTQLRVRHLRGPVRLAALVALACLFGSCTTDQRQSTATPVNSVDNALTRLLECLPPDVTSTSDPLRITISSINHLPKQTRIELVAWAENGSTTLNLPLYVRSRGRWILGENERVYLVDQECRTYGLNDVEFRQPRLSPGIIGIPAHQAIRGALLFPPLGPRSRLGALVFGHRTLPVILAPMAGTGRVENGGDEG